MFDMNDNLDFAKVMIGCLSPSVRENEVSNKDIELMRVHFFDRNILL
jgi:hypothetical protein